MSLKIGDTILWTFPDDHGSEHSGKTYSAVIAGIELDEQVYLVHAEYGQDRIPFDLINSRDK